MRVEADSGQHQEVPAATFQARRQQAGWNASRDPAAHIARHVDPVSRQTQLGGQHIRRARRKDAQRHLLADHPVDDFVDGTVAAGDQDQVGATADAVGDKPCRRIRPFGGHGLDFVSRMAENLDGAVDTRDAPTIEAARRGVVCEERVPVDRSCGSAYAAAQL